MATMRDIKRRKASIESTEQITKAMKLVATVKLQKSRTRAENSRLYFNKMYRTIQEMLKKSQGIEHKYLKAGDSKKKAVIVITSNRGLAGGYNANIVRLVAGSGISMEDAKIFAVGRKGRDGLSRKGYEITADYSEVINEPLYSDAMQITKELLALFEKNEIGEIYLAYTSFKNTVSQIPKLMKLLPVDARANEPSDEQAEAGMQKPDLLLMNYEPDESEVLDAIIPKYVSSLIYGAFLEAVASENGARMTAMDSATNNAEEMISKLSLQYNRARQGSITQELTEIIAGANAIEG
ncbi:MAG: ATP synthase F1 subunit gamma [Lachnospiraceae bacterium]|nr:ATP synthase F1 subunit gamma [Lachnospiraceae bacterium]